MGADVCVHDPYVEQWWEFTAQDTFPASGTSKAQFFHNQGKLRDLQIEPDLRTALQDADVAIFAVRHKQFLNLKPEEVVKAAGGPLAVIDCFGILNDEQITRYLELGCEVKGLGRGHISRIKKQLERKKLEECS